MRSAQVDAVLSEQGLSTVQIAEWHQYVGDLDDVVMTSTLPPLAEVIAFLAGTDPDSWWAGPTYRSPDGTQHCVISHVFEQWGAPAAEEFESRYSTSYAIGSANDGTNPRYPQHHAKDRVLAFLANLAAGFELTTHESMNLEGLLTH